MQVGFRRRMEFAEHVIVCTTRIGEFKQPGVADDRFASSAGPLEGLPHKVLVDEAVMHGVVHQLGGGPHMHLFQDAGAIRTHGGNA